MMSDPYGDKRIQELEDILERALGEGGHGLMCPGNQSDQPCECWVKEGRAAMKDRRAQPRQSL